MKNVNDCRMYNFQIFEYNRKRLNFLQGFKVAIDKFATANEASCRCLVLAHKDTLPDALAT